MMRSHGEGRLTKPVHDIRFVLGVLVSSLAEDVFGWRRFRERCHTDHDVYDRFSAKTNHGGTPDVFDWPRAPGCKQPFKERLLALESFDP